VQTSGDTRGVCLIVWPPPNSSIEQWRMLVINCGYTMLVTSKYDVVFTFANQRFGEVCWHNMHSILHSPYSFVVQCVTVLNINYQRFTSGDRSETQHSTSVAIWYIYTKFENFEKYGIVSKCLLYKFLNPFIWKFWYIFVGGLIWVFKSNCLLYWKA